MAKTQPLKRGQSVWYQNGRGLTFRALVRVLHRDGSVSVEPYFQTDRATGRDIGVYQGGHRVRLDAADLELRRLVK